ncbi:MAG: hypothetical protein ACPGWR_27900 [Ardenticatenaceae bacterium]
MKSDFSLLLCGRPDSSSELGDSLLHISSTLDRIIGQVEPLFKSDEEQITLYGPFLGRSILDLGCAALIGRLEAFRILVLRKMQEQSDYDIGVRHKISIQWQGDVVASKRVSNLWADKEMSKVTRALVGDYYDHIFWRTALEKVLTTVQPNKDDKWLEELITIGTQGFCNWARTDLNELYSSFSKGLHHEFVIPPKELFDSVTIIRLIKNSFKVMASLGFVMNSISYLPFVIGMDEAIQSYKKIENMVEKF